MVGVGFRRYVPIVFPCICTFSMGGIIFGASSIIPVLYRHGYWISLCNAAKAATCKAHQSHIECCEQQLVRLSMIISLCFFLCDFSAAPWGELADRRGPRICLISATAVSVLGMSLLGLSTIDPTGCSNTLTTIGLVALAVAGPGVFNGGYVGSLSMIGEDPDLKAILASCSAAVFDGSALVFMLLQMAEGTLGGDFTTPSLSWALMCAMLGGGYFLYLRPRPLASAPLNAVNEEGSTELATLPSTEKPIPRVDSGATASSTDEFSDGVGSPMNAHRVKSLNEDYETDESDWGRQNSKDSRTDDTLLNQGQESSDADARGIASTMLARSNLLMVYFMAVYGLISNFYIETQLDEFGLRFGEPTAEWLSTTFNLAFPVGGFMMALPSSLIMKSYGDKPYIYWSIVSCFAAGFAFLSMIPTEGTQLAAALLFGPTRCLQWACYFQFLADEKRYPPHLTGRAIGYNNVAIGLVGDVLPSLLTYLVATHGWGGTKEGRYTSLKLITFVLLMLSSSFPALLFREQHSDLRLPAKRTKKVPISEVEATW
mmetsp:Transcript_27605/g.66891  ORF Transcript_27605/g.66891 Transcript_27605/m.66891 type:complete len:543 (+) Transcript_27605:3-1631(+)